MLKLRIFLKYWLPPLAWMLLIFTGSSDAKSLQHSSLFVEPFLRWLFPHMTPAHVEEIHYFIRKCAHLTEYAVLALLFWRAVRRPVKNDHRPWSWREAGVALFLVFLYSASDEFHQRFVPNRSCDVADWAADTFGGFIAASAYWIYESHRSSKKYR